MKRILGLVFVTACGGGRVDPGFYGDVQAEPAAPPARSGQEAAPSGFQRPKLVLIRAAWCDACRQLEPSIFAAHRRYAGRVDLVVLDVTDDASIRRSARAASAEGVSEFFGTWRGRTPTVGVFVAPEEARLVRGPLSDVAYLERELEAAVERFAARR